MQEERYFKDTFMNYWRETVRPQAEIVAALYPKMKSLEARELRGEQIPENDPDLMELKNHPDATTAWYVGLMIGDIDFYNIKGIRLTVINSISSVHGTLTSESYWTNVWKNDWSSEYAKNVSKLADMMRVLIKLL